MLTVIRDADQRLLAACEWHLVNTQGERVSDGPYVYVDELELSPSCSQMRVIRHLIRRIAQTAPGAVGAYWERWTKYRTNRLHGFRRHQLVREEVRV